jgi:hypothetical protein
MATYATTEGNILLFAYADLPAGVAESPDTLLQGLVEALVQNDAHLQIRKILYGPQKLPGREVVWSKDTIYLKARYILHNRRLYQIGVFGSPSFIDSNTARDFLASFTLN